MFSMGERADDVALMLGADYKQHLEQHAQRHNLPEPLVHKLREVLAASRTLSVSRQTLSQEQRLSARELAVLVKAGLLTMRDADSFWFAVPNAGAFTRSLRHGRKEIISALRRAKYRCVSSARPGRGRGEGGEEGL